MQQLYHPTPPASNVQDAGGGAGILADGRFVDTSALAPVRMGGGVALPVKILTVKV